MKDGLADKWRRLERLQGPNSVGACAMYPAGWRVGVLALLDAWCRVVALVASPLPDACAGTSR